MHIGLTADAAMQSIAVIERDGNLTHSGAAVLPIYSLTKTFIAACVMQSDIDLNTTIDRWFGRDWVPEGSRISLAQLLSHTSGLPDYFSSVADYARAVEKQRARLV